MIEKCGHKDMETIEAKKENLGEQTTCPNCNGTFELWELPNGTFLLLTVDFIENMDLRENKD